MNRRRRPGQHTECSPGCAFRDTPVARTGELHGVRVDTRPPSIGSVVLPPAGHRHRWKARPVLISPSRCTDGRRHPVAADAAAHDDAIGAGRAGPCPRRGHGWPSRSCWGCCSSAAPTREQPELRRSASARGGVRTHMESPPGGFKTGRDRPSSRSRPARTDLPGAFVQPVQPVLSRIAPWAQVLCTFCAPSPVNRSGTQTPRIAMTSRVATESRSEA